MEKTYDRMNTNIGVSPTKNQTRVLRYVKLPADKIFNWLSPKNVTAWVNFPELRSTWTSLATVKIRDWIQSLYITKFDFYTGNGHFINLEASMVKDGFHNPINTITGQPRDMYMRNIFPDIVVPDYYDSLPLICTHTFGGSRLIIARKYNMLVPCLVYDYINAFPDATVIKSINQLKELFTNAYHISSMQSPVIVRAIKHTHMPDSKNDGKERNLREKVVKEIREDISDELRKYQ